MKGNLRSHEGDTRFIEYYLRESITPETRARFLRTLNGIVRLFEAQGRVSTSLDVLDVGCGAGTQAIVWAERGHNVAGLDINQPLIEAAKIRAMESGLHVDFRVGPAEALPWPDASMDVCSAPELLEHVSDWRICLDEFARVLRPGGILYLSTTNKLCPRQQEFRLPLYSWYPAPAKRYFEKRATSSMPWLVNYATYPAVHWFSYYQLRRELRERGLDSRDRLDFMDLESHSAFVRLIANWLRAAPGGRFLLQLFTPYTLVVGIRTPAPPS